MGMFCLSSCAVMFNGSRKTITVKSITPNATIYLDGEEKGTGTVNEKVARKYDHTITVTKEGCETKTMELRRTVQVGWIVFDALFNWFAFATDAPTGAWNSFDKDHISVELKCPVSSK